MDYLRSCYRSGMRLYRDRPDVIVWGQWRWCRPDAKPIPFTTAFGAATTWDGWANYAPDAVGEVLRGEWVRGTPDPRYLGQHVCGDEEHWMHGSLYSERGTPAVRPDGVPGCCGGGRRAGLLQLDLSGMHWTSHRTDAAPSHEKDASSVDWLSQTSYAGPAHESDAAAASWRMEASYAAAVSEADGCSVTWYAGVVDAAAAAEADHASVTYYGAAVYSAPAHEADQCGVLEDTMLTVSLSGVGSVFPVTEIIFDSAYFSETNLGGGSVEISLLSVSGSGAVLLQTTPTLVRPTINQGTNGSTIIKVVRATDVGPTGKLLDFRNAADSASLWSVDATGALTAGSVPAANVSGLATSATVDATNASNLSSGTIPSARLGSDVLTFAATALSATGTTQGGAAVVSAMAHEVTTATSQAGVKLIESGSGIVTLHSKSTNVVNLSVYPPTGGKIGAAGTNVAVGLAAGACAMFVRTVSTAGAQEWHIFNAAS